MSRCLYIDIGSKETKILDAELSADNIVVHNTAEMQDMSMFVTERGLIGDIQGFCASLKQTLIDHKITTSDAIVCSSAFGMENKDISGDFQGYKDCKHNFESKYGSDMMACSWQYFGEIARRNAPVQRLLMTMCKRDYLNSFIEAMKVLAGINVISMESDFTALANLAKLHKYDFETPATCVVSVSSVGMQCQFFVQGSLAGVENYKCKLSDISQQIANTFEIDERKATKILYSIGAEKNIDNGSVLAASGINSTKYYDLINSVVEEDVKCLTSHIDMFKNKYRQSGVCIILAGGVFSAPYFAQLFMSKCKGHPAIVAEVTSASKTTRCRDIIRKTDKRISSKFGGCLGLLLKDKRYTVNVLRSPHMQRGSHNSYEGLREFLLFVLITCLATLLFVYLGLYMRSIAGSLYKMSNATNSFSQVQESSSTSQEEVTPSSLTSTSQGQMTTASTSRENSK